jgi:hypothetical protein
MGKNTKADIEYHFEHGEVIHYTLDGVSIHPITINDTGVKGNCSGISP